MTHSSTLILALSSVLAMAPQCEDDNTDDRDKDGVPNSEDNCPDFPNLIQLDPDEDGLGNVCDNCPDIPNEAQLDADEDGDFGLVLPYYWRRHSIMGDCN